MSAPQAAAGQPPPAGAPAPPDTAAAVGAERTPSTSRASLRGTLLVFASYLAFSAAWSWPVARLDPDVLVTRQFDLFPTVWLLARAHAEPFTLEHAASAWPVGETLARIDSYVILPLAWIFGGLVDPRVLAGLLAWVGPALGALAAERSAACAFGVPRPASWVAGVVYGFSGITATALLEGHVYHAVNPWLPLLLCMAWRAQQPDGRWLYGFAAAGAWALALLTTAYAGVLGALLLVVVGLRGGIARLVAGMLLVGLPAGLLYLDLFQAGDGWADGDHVEPGQVLAMGSATLATLAGWGDNVDLRYHSIGAPVGWAGLFAMLLAPVVLRGRSGWRTLVGLALLALVVSLGRYVRIEPGGLSWPSPLGLLVDVPGIQHFRFPVRTTWLYALCAAMVAARVVAALGERVGRPALFATLLVFPIDAVVTNGLPWRLARKIGETPTAYAAAPSDRAVLDLWARSVDRSSGELEMWSRALGCYYQAFHARPVLEVCMGTQIESPREVTDRWLTTRLLAPTPETDLVRARLGQLAVGAVALHADVYLPGDRAALADALSATFGPPAADTVDGGEHVLLWVVPAVADADPAAAWAAIRAER